MNSADAILAAATDLAARGMGKHGSGKVWIADVVAALTAQNAGWTADDVAAEIVAAYEAGALRLCRVDVACTFDAALVTASEVVLPSEDGRDNVRHLISTATLGR